MSSICYMVFHRQNMSTLQTDNNWSKYTRKLFEFTHPPRDFGSGGTKSSAFLCLHAEKISFLELRVAISGLKTMVNFSHMQSLQTPVTGLNVGMLVLKNFQDMVGFFPASCSLRKWVERVVLFWGEGFSMLPLCLLYLDLNFLAKPTYDWVFLPLSEVMVAW